MEKGRGGGSRSSVQVHVDLSGIKKKMGDRGIQKTFEQSEGGST